MMFSTFQSLRTAVVFIVTTALLASCSTLNSLLPTPVPLVATETPLPSPTFAWFPATSTATPQILLTYAPTPEMRPGLGDVFLADDFSDPSLWDVATSDQASAEIMDRQLNIAVQSRMYLTSLRRKLTLGNFYAEITARPGLCRSDDAYGLLVRANAVAYYRFALSCNGTVGVDRISAGQRHALQSPLPSGDVPPGAPGEVRIGVWAVGKEMRLFLNGRYQFTVTDPSYASGTVGVFVKSAGNTAAVVSFSDLIVRDVTYIPPTRTPQP